MCLRPSGRIFSRESAIKYPVHVEESEEGFAVSMPGYHSQGDAIREYLGVARCYDFLAELPSPVIGRGIPRGTFAAPGGGFP